MMEKSTTASGLVAVVWLHRDRRGWQHRLDLAVVDADGLGAVVRLVDPHQSGCQLEPERRG